MCVLMCEKRENEEQGMKRADMETTGGDKGRQGARVTKQRLKETSASLSRNEALRFHFPFKALCQGAEVA